MRNFLRNAMSAAMLLTLAGVMTTAAMAADAKAGEAVYGTKCKACHGADGKGNPGMAKAMGVEFKPLNTYSEDAVKKAITGGAGKMKAVASVTGADLDNVVAFVKSMK